MLDHTFISYAHEDSRFAMKLSRQLRRHGVAIWLDQWDISAEIEWDKTIERAVRNCGCFVLVLSPAAVNSWVVRQQFSWARQNGKPILPVIYRACELPSTLQEHPQIDFTKQRYRMALAQLLSHYFPAEEKQLDYWERLKVSWTGIDWGWWHRLRLLLWPGWLGPMLLLALLLLGVYFIRSDNGQTPKVRPTVETLAVISPTATPIANVDFKIRPIDNKTMLLVPAGEFFMGSVDNDPFADEDEWPQHAVYIDAFWVDKTEVTNSEFQYCVEAGKCDPHLHVGNTFAGADQPVVGVDWFQAATYCEWVGGRLPTEAEWEKAARGTDGRTYPWGNKFDGSRLNYCDANCIQDWRDNRFDDGYKYTSPVGSYPTGASPYGLLDMSGNVWEWTADWYDKDYYVTSTYQNPTGPSSGQQRVIRGGSWHYAGRNLRVVNRHKDSPAFRYDKIGFRCVVDELDKINDNAPDGLTQ